MKIAAALVVEAARNRALPPVPPGYTQTIDPETDDVFYTHPYTKARVSHSNFLTLQQYCLMPSFPCACGFLLIILIHPFFSLLSLS